MRRADLASSSALSIAKSFASSAGLPASAASPTSLASPVSPVSWGAALVAAGLAVGALAGCPDRTISEVDPQQGRVEAKDIPVNSNRDVDILFLIDNSPSMGDKQANLAANFPQFINVLSTIPGGLPNVQIGVATSDLGTLGADGNTGPNFGSLGRGGCANRGLAGALQLSGVTTNGQPWLSDIQPADLTQPRQRNYTGDLATTFAQMAKVGAGGCGFEQHLEGIKQALEPSNTANAGFVRDSAFLAVIIIADEDDCSIEHSALLGPDSATLGPRESFRCTRFGVTCTGGGGTTDAMNVPGAKTECHPNDSLQYLTKVSDYATFLNSVKHNQPGKVIVAGIVGVTDPFEVDLEVPEGSPPGTTTKVPTLVHSCHYNGADGLEVADPAVRISSFLDQFPNRNTLVPICQQDLSGGLQQIANLLKSVVGDPCIEGKLAGPPYDCSVTAQTDPTLPNPITRVVPRCNPDDGSGTTQACWHIVTDPVRCMTAQNLLLKVEHEDTDMILSTNNSHIVANCVTEAN